MINPMNALKPSPLLAINSATVNSKPDSPLSPLLDNDGAFINMVEKHLGVGALRDIDMAALSPEERASILAEAELVDLYAYGKSTIRDSNVRSLRTLVDTYANNQAYNGPGASDVATTIKNKDGSEVPITMAQLQNDEGFRKLADDVFMTAGGQGRQIGGTTLLLRGPGAVMGSGNFGGADLAKWSAEERISFLQEVAKYGTDGSVSDSELDALRAGVQTRNKEGGEAVSLTLPNGKKVTYDDVMENTTLQKQMSDLIPKNILTAPTDAEKELRNTIERSDYATLSFDERSTLLMKLSEATKDGKLTDENASSINTTMKAYLAATSSDGPGKNLSNGLFVPEADVTDPKQFANQIQQTLKQSGIGQAETHYADDQGLATTTAGSANDSNIPLLLNLDVSKLSVDQRYQVLGMIADKTSKDRVFSSTDLSDVQTAVREMGGSSVTRA
jgi:hypothetical protein